ncbi:hypothetical protein I5907_17055 [Panacibacter sp. DH6]|uniref:Uncharacterized protein n=1 Tax=Panacibacter microcysteis TaxID=2793269 RepID=A0A931GYZ9_9BACT|nr:hypothetical protein [Panacibacter microcysteis]MBG9377950.1 hypothetical protein [Panacibacter microcysteis]
MLEDQFVIRQSKKKQIGIVLLTAGLIIYYFVGPYEKTRIIYKESPTFTIILGIVFFTLLGYFLNELITRKAEIILNKEGIELRDKGFFTWDMIESFSTLYYRYSENRNIDLVLHFKEYADMKFDITRLEQDKDQITELIMKYKGTASLYFVSHETK